MNNEIIVKEEKAANLAAVEDYKKIATQWLTSTGNLQKFTESEKAQFLDICQAYKLNPIKKEVYGVKYKDKFNLIVGYESYIKRAERSGRLDGWGVEVKGSGSDMKAVLTIYRKDFTKPFIHEVYLEEYNTHQNLWLTKPRTMLKKVAIAQGFRMCFSEELGGIPYTSEELGDIAAAQPVDLAETAPTVKAETTPIVTETTPKNFNEKKDAAETVEAYTPTPCNNVPKIKLYTKDQADKLAAVMTRVYKNGDPIFTDEEKKSFKTQLVNGEFEGAYKSALDILNFRLDDAGEMAAEIESELDN